MHNARWLLLPLLALVVLAYLPGLSGPFVFDDTVHISRNVQVHIQDLSWDSLVQAWHSSLAHGVSSRPLTQLTFGINHAVSGLETWPFKATNLAIHLLAGLLVFALVRQLTRVLARNNPAADTPWPALLSAGLWLLHPINLTPVLYVVQRMSSLSALFVLAGLWCHVTGRLRMADGDRRGFWLALAGLPVAAFGGLAKESAALYPLLVLVLEWTLLRELKSPRRTVLLAVVGWLPLLIGAAYLLTHLGLTNHGGRDFTLVERLMTEARVLWLYLRMLAVPDLSVLGFYHDDVATSRSLLTPWTTLPAILSWLVLIPAAPFLARRWPVVSFGLLFFLAGHALESTIFPLELVFEHRNYLPSLGPLFAVAWLMAYPYPARVRRLVGLVAVLMLAALALLTHLRARDWSDQERLVLAEVRHHPSSPRANFRTAQLLMDHVGKGANSDKVYQAARYHLERVRQLDPADNNALFGLLFLELFAGHDPAPELVDTLVDQLRHGVVDPTKLTISQFSFLVRWQMQPHGHKLTHNQALAICQAAADNPRMNSQGRAAVLSAMYAYYDLVLKDPQAALPYAVRTVRSWPYRWRYHYRLVQLLLRLGQYQQAQQAFEEAIRIPSAALHSAQVNELRTALARASAVTLPRHD